MSTERRNTKQRELVLSALLNNFSHPTALQVYDMVKSIDPKLSISTVYRNLDILVEEGKIIKIKMPDEKFYRFDFNVKKHYHIKCRHCGRIVDLEQKKIDLLGKLKTLTDFDDITCELAVFGLCPDCRKDNDAKKLS